MPEQFKQNSATISKYQGMELKTEEDKRLFKKYAALGKKITDNVAAKIGGVTTDSPEFWGLREVLSEEEVDVALTMKLRKWYTIEELFEMNKKQFTMARLKELVDELSVHGLIEYDYGDFYNDDGPIPNSPAIKRYRISFFVPGSAELFNSSKDRVDKAPPVASFFERMTFLPLEHITSMVPPGGDGIGMHVIPVEKEVQASPESVKLEKISYWLKKYEGHIGVGLCSCRHVRQVLGEGCGDDYQSWCIGVGDFADYCRETGMGHDITYDEAMDILRKAEKLGYVHQITNIDGENKIYGI